jgi:tRNA(Arg) A34 adenosine deaminase TadA
MLHSSVEKHEVWMRRAYALARQAADNGDHPFSALLVIDEEIVLECLNTVHTGADATRHPELDILRQGAERLGQSALREATLVASTEPCAMCTGAIYWAGVRRLIYGCPTQLLAKVASGRFVVPSRDLLAMGKQPPEVIGPVLAEEGLAIHEAYWTADQMSLQQ